ncbi:MAG TPA: kelch repeat-containing protein [Puia sp.]|nr:kelch repeat-containing protein [Puia sp.]
MRRIITPVIGFLIVTVFSNSFCTKASLSYLQDGDWIQAHAIEGYPRGSASSFVIGNTAYVGLGYNESIGGSTNFRLKDFWSFNSDTGWTQLADFPGAARSGASAFSIDNYGYVGTGWDGINRFDDFYRYDPAQGVWNKKADFPGGTRYDAIGFSVKGKGYIGTGFSIYTLSDFYQYDPGSDKWDRTPSTDLNFSKRKGAVAFVYNDKAYVVTGSNNGTMTRDFWEFDPTQTGPWKPLANITNTDPGTFDDGYTDIQREYATAFVQDGKAYLVTGQNGSLRSSTWVYDFSTTYWTQRTPYPRALRAGAVAFTIGGKSYIGMGSTGVNSGNTFDNLDIFDPDKAFNPND